MDRTADTSVLEKFTLSEERLKVATCTDRNVLVFAGPGAGKTYVLVAHACWLAHQRAGRVIILTYSKAAATDIKRRVDTALETGERRLVVAQTIHAHALEILRAHGHRLGIRADAEPIEAKDLQEVADTVARRNNVAIMQDFAVRFEQFQRLAGNIRSPKLPPLVRLVDNELRSTGRLDWGSCIRIATELLATNHDIRTSVMQHNRFVLLDEAQDCDASQLEFLEQLVGPPPGERHLFVAMDPDQSLYAFRQANPELVREWAERYVSEPKEITENRRCAKRIQAIAAHVLEKYWSDRMDDGRTTLHCSDDRDAEGSWLAEKISTRIGAGTAAGRIAILARRRSRLDAIGAALSLAQVETRADPREVWTPPEEKLLVTLAFIKDWRAQVLATDTTTTYLVKVARFNADRVREFEQECVNTETPPGDALEFEPWKELVMWLENHRPSPLELVDHLAQADNVEQDEVRALRVLAKQARNLAELLKVARVGPAVRDPTSPAGVLVTTFHGAKGLEFDAVFIVGCEDGTIPDFRAREEKELKEERRALYVAVTRAAREACFCWLKRDRSRLQRLSRFLPEPNSPLWSLVE